jgi:hypothetical protein
VTVPLPGFISKSRMDQALDDAHQQALDRVVNNILSAPIEEQNFAQISMYSMGTPCDM